MEKKTTCSNASGKENESGMDVYSLIRSAEIRDYYRKENICDSLEKKTILIQYAFISVQQKAAMLRQLSGTGTVEENRLTEEMCFIYSRYLAMIYHPLVRTIFVMEYGEFWWYEGQLDDKVGFDSVYESLDEMIAQMESICNGKDREKSHAYVTVLHVPPDEKVKEVFQFNIFWIDGKWEIRDFFVDKDELMAQGISNDTIGFFRFYGGMQYHPLPFENGCRLKFRLPFMKKPVYGTLESELDGNGCWYHFLYFDEVDGVCQGSVSLTNAEIDLTSGYSSLDWIERA